MKKIIFILVVFGVFGCGKYTTPKKVSRKIVSGTWNIQKFMDNDTSIIGKYTGILMSFGEDGNVETTSDSKVSGTWEVGSDRNPAILYINFPDETDSMHVLSDDWIVYKITKSECILKRNKGEMYDYKNSENELSLSKKL